MNFVLFNKICYSIPTTFVTDLANGERICDDEHPESTLVKFHSHQSDNINVTRFLGRSFDDVLLEFFHYQLEEKVKFRSTSSSTKKQWLRLLLGNTSDPKACVLRHFNRVSGGFLMHSSCTNGGYPVCQCQPVRKKVTVWNDETGRIQNSSFDARTESPGMPSVARSVFNSTERTCENCSASLLHDENLSHNGTHVDSLSNNGSSVNTSSESTKHRYKPFQPLLVILTGPVLGLVLLFSGVTFLLCYLRHNRGSHSARSSIIMPPHRNTRSSTVVTVSDVTNTPVVVYRRSKPLPSAETDRLLRPDPFILNDEDTAIEMLSRLTGTVPSEPNQKHY